MKKIKLYGHLAKKFGKSYDLDVKTPAEAVRALCAIIPEFKQHLIDNGSYKVFFAGSSCDKDDLSLSRSGDVIQIVPVIVGAGKGLGRILLGAVLVVASFFYPPASAMLMSLGKSLIMGGIAQVLFSSDEAAAPQERPGSVPSFVFDGSVNTHREGNPVPLGSGEGIRIGGQVISSGLSVSDIPV